MFFDRGVEPEPLEVTHFARSRSHSNFVALVARTLEASIV